MNIPMVFVQTEDVIQHYKKYRYGKELAGLLKEIFLNTLIQSTIKILLEILARNIHDGRFIRLISNMLEAGYLEEWKFNQTISGVPQGGVISPILAKYLSQRI